LTYRSEIDGLRAIAVSFVVAYHFFPKLIPSGYLGVDIFFVISGYLITNHLLKIKNNDVVLTLRQFYERRVKRLFPALFVFLSISALVLLFILLNSDYTKFISSLIAAKTFWANIFFWIDGGYFGGNDQLKPLLHTWSLSVEEQFYLLYPSFIIFSLWVKKKLRLPITFFLGILTLSSFILWIYLNKIGGENPAFFLLPTRVWQFGLGGLIATIQFQYFLNFKRYFSTISIISFVLILLGFFAQIDKQIQTMLVSIGTATFIFFTFKNTNFIILILKSYILTKLGKISYSVYLYHWPVSVSLVYYYISDPPIMISILGILASFCLGFFSYRFIEVPFRYRFSLNKTVILILTCVFFILSLKNFHNKFNNENYYENWAKVTGTNYRCPYSSYFFYGASRACILEENKIQNKKIVLLGNSHAQMYAPLFSESLRKSKFSGILVPLNGCLPTVTINIEISCFELAKKNLETIINDESIIHVFISMTWYKDSYIDENGNNLNSNLLKNSVINLINEIKSKNKTVSLVSPIAIPKQELSSELPRQLKFKWLTKKEIYKSTLVKRKKYDQEFKDLNLIFDKMLGQNYIKVFDDLCDLENCYFIKDNIMYFSDSSHLSEQIMGKLINSKKQIVNILDSL
tara:strand:- start:275 stop:2170 length:1896 start_codon:yes stop_codon:yes gene_type:complete